MLCASLFMNSLIWENNEKNLKVTYNEVRVIFGCLKDEKSKTLQIVTLFYYVEVNCLFCEIVFLLLNNIVFTIKCKLICNLVLSSENFVLVCSLSFCLYKSLCWRMELLVSWKLVWVNFGPCWHFWRSLSIDVHIIGSKQHMLLLLGSNCILNCKIKI